MLNDIKVYRPKSCTEVQFCFKKVVVYLDVKVTSHLDQLYKVAIGEKELEIMDLDVEKVDPLLEAGMYRIFMITDAKHTFESWKVELAKRGLTEKELEVLKTDELPYDLQVLVDELFDHASKNLLKSLENPGEVKPYYSLSTIMGSELAGKLFGQLAGALMLNDPMAGAFAMLWLHGYLTSTALRKQAIKLEIEEIPVAKEVIEEKQKQYTEFLTAVMEGFRKHIQEGWEGHGDQEQQQ